MKTAKIIKVQNFKDYTKQLIKLSEQYRSYEFFVCFSYKGEIIISAVASYNKNKTEEVLYRGKNEFLFDVLQKFNYTLKF